MPKSYTRPGVAAAARLVELECSDRASVWERIEAQYGDAIAEKGGDNLVALDKYCEDLSNKLAIDGKNPSVSKDDLLKVVEWKFAKGKPRYALMNYLKSNKPEDVVKFSRSAFDKSTGGDISGAVKDLCELQGVGPATASALLTLHRGDLFAFMDDEVIEALCDGKRGYTLKIYLEVNAKCTDLARKLGEENWTPRRIGRALWTSARLCASGGTDLTVSKESTGGNATMKRKKRGNANKASKEQKESAKPTVKSTKRKRK